jgi:hypothetical protein
MPQWEELLREFQPEQLKICSVSQIRVSFSYIYVPTTVPNQEKLTNIKRELGKINTSILLLLLLADFQTVLVKPKTSEHNAL